MRYDAFPFRHIIDPELLIPDEAYKADIDFWYRMCQIPDFATIIAIGPNTRAAFDLFIEGNLDSIYKELDPFLADPDIWTLYAQIDNLPDCDQETRSSRVFLPDELYQPKYGSCKNRSIIQTDLNETCINNILTDYSTWNCNHLKSNEKLSWIKLADINSGVHACIRLGLESNPSYSSLNKKAREAFPNLRFCNESWSTTRKLLGEERINSKILLEYFSILNDSALTVWQKYKNNHERILQMSALGIDCSPENGETDNNNKRIAERCYHLEGESFEMNWHAKLFRNRNRFYFVVDPEKNRVIIGGFTDHFATR